MHEDIRPDGAGLNEAITPLVALYHFTVSVGISVTLQASDEGSGTPTGRSPIALGN